MSKTKNHYDKLYSSEKSAFGLGKPEDIVVEAVNFLSKDASIIEYGAGQGRNSLYLAKLGFNVLATDISSVGLEQISRKSKELSLDISTEVKDATARIDKDYDFIISTFMTHHLKRDEALDFIERAKNHTKKGGLNALIVFTKEGDFFKKDPTTDFFYPDLDELRNIYSDWEIIKYDERKSRAHSTNPDGSPMFNTNVEILACKK